jgi:hypothetical protein
MNSYSLFLRTDIGSPPPKGTKTQENYLLTTEGRWDRDQLDSDVSKYLIHQ